MKMDWLLVVAGAGAIAAAMFPRDALAYIQGVAVNINLEPIGDGFELERVAALDFVAMRAAANRSGVVLKVNSAFRTMSAQQSLYDRFTAGIAGAAAAARPGFSNHQSGRAVDIEVHRSYTSATYLWLKSNAGNYGFFQPAWARQGGSTEEPWHWEHA